MIKNTDLIIGMSIFLLMITIFGVLSIYLFKKDKIKVLTALLTAFLIISNIIVSKFTVLFGLKLPASILIYPFTFLFTATIAHYEGFKESIKSVVIAIVIQIIVSLALYNILILAPDQVDTIVATNQLRGMVGTSISSFLKILLPSILAFGISQIITSGIYVFLKKYTYRGLSVALSILLGTIIDTFIFSTLTMIGEQDMLSIILNKFIMNVGYTFIMVFMFLIFTINIKNREKTK